MPDFPKFLVVFGGPSHDLYYLFHPEIASLNFLRYTGAAMQATQQYAPVIPEEMLAKPLSDDLGYYRILRTSTLAAVPGVCCVDC